MFFTGCTALGARQAGVTDVRTLSFMAMQDTYLLALGTYEEFARECARGNARALAKQADVDAKWREYSAIVITLTRGLRANWQPTTPEDQAKLVSTILQMLIDLGITPRPSTTPIS